MVPLGGAKDEDDRPPTSAEFHLRSVNEVAGYRVRGTDEAVGHVDDFLVDDQTWQIRYLVIDAGTWWRGRRVLVAPEWATSVSWVQRRVYIGLSRQSIKTSPEWHAKAPVNREYEAHLFDHYGQPVYWARPPSSPVTPPSGRQPA